MFTAFPASAAVVGGGVIATVMQLAGHAGGNTPEVSAGRRPEPPGRRGKRIRLTYLHSCRIVVPLTMMIDKGSSGLGRWHVSPWRSGSTRHRGCRRICSWFSRSSRRCGWAISSRGIACRRFARWSRTWRSIRTPCSRLTANWRHKGLTSGRPGQGTFIDGSLGQATLPQLAGLRRSLRGWLAEADAAGLDEEGIVALVTSTMRDFSERRDVRQRPRRCAGHPRSRRGGVA